MEITTFVEGTSEYIKDIYLYEYNDDGFIVETPTKMFKSKYAKSHICYAGDEKDEYICRIYDEEGSFYNNITWLSEPDLEKAIDIYLEHFTGLAEYYSAKMSKAIGAFDSISIAYSLKKDGFNEMLKRQFEKRAKEDK